MVSCADPPGTGLVASFLLETTRARDRDVRQDQALLEAATSRGWGQQGGTHVAHSEFPGKEIKLRHCGKQKRL
jgi:hypothetical protein